MMGNSGSVEQRIDELIRLLNRYQKEYYQDSSPSVSDLHYDALMDELLALETSHPELKRNDSPSVRVGSDLSSSFPEVSHTAPMLSLDKVYESEGIVQWMMRHRKNGWNDLSYTIEEKIDGVSLVLYYRDGLLEKAVTRGNGYIGNDVTANARTIRSIPLSIPDGMTLAVRGEVFISKKAFSALNSEMETPYANARNLASGSLRRLRSSETARIPLAMYVYDAYAPGGSLPAQTHTQMLEYLKRAGFPVNPSLAVVGQSEGEPPSFARRVTLEELPLYLDQLYRKRQSLEHEIDGMVIKVNEMAFREAIGYTNHHPKWALAYKFDSPQGVSVLEGIDVQVGRTGRVTPVARIRPVRVAGSTISNITLHNQEYISLLELAVGDTVAISKRGDVIPAVEKVIDKNEDGIATYHMPSFCPSCGSTLVLRGAHTFCENPMCPHQVVGRIKFFVGRNQMDIESFGPETVQYLFDTGLIRDIQDLYTVDYRQLIGCEGFGEKKVAQLEKSIEASKERDFSTVLVSLGLPELGKKGVQLLMESGIRDIDTLLDIIDREDRSRLLQIKGFGERSVSLLFDALNEVRMRALIADLRSAGLQFAEKEDTGEIRSSLFEGQTWVITGSFEHFTPRSLAQKELENRGAKVTSAVTGSTTHLLAGEKAGSKRSKAEQLGIQIVNEQEFLALLEEDTSA